MEALQPSQAAVPATSTSSTHQAAPQSSTDPKVSEAAQKQKQRRVLERKRKEQADRKAKAAAGAVAATTAQSAGEATDAGSLPQPNPSLKSPSRSARRKAAPAAASEPRPAADGQPPKLAAPSSSAAATTITTAAPIAITVESNEETARVAALLAELSSVARTWSNSLWTALLLGQTRNQFESMIAFLPAQNGARAVIDAAAPAILRALEAVWKKFLQSSRYAGPSANPAAEPCLDTLAETALLDCTNELGVRLRVTQAGGSPAIHAKLRKKCNQLIEEIKTAQAVGKEWLVQCQKLRDLSNTHFTAPNFLEEANDVLVSVFPSPVPHAHSAGRILIYQSSLRSDVAALIEKVVQSIAMLPTGEQQQREEAQARWIHLLHLLKKHPYAQQPQLKFLSWIRELEAISAPVAHLAADATSMTNQPLKPPQLRNPSSAPHPHSGLADGSDGSSASVTHLFASQQQPGGGQAAAPAGLTTSTITNASRRKARRVELRRMEREALRNAAAGTLPSADGETALQQSPGASSLPSSRPASRTRRVIRAEEVAAAASAQQLFTAFLESDKLPALNSELLSFYDSRVLSPEELSARRFVLHRVRHFVAEVDPGLTAEVFGSSASNTATKGSDMDVAIVTKGGKRLHKDTPKFVLTKLLRRLRDPALNKGRFRNALGILGARVPILKFTDALTGVQVDLAVSQDVHAYKSQLMHAYTEMDPRVPQLIAVVKAWAKARNLNDASSGTLNSFGYALLVVQYLQMVSVNGRSILPSLQKQAEIVHEEERKIHLEKEDDQAQAAAAAALAPHAAAPSSATSSASFSDYSSFAFPLILPPLLDPLLNAFHSDPRETQLFIRRVEATSSDATGSVSSSSLSVAAKTTDSPSLAALLLGFFHFYGYLFSASSHAVWIRAGGLCSKHFWLGSSVDPAHRLSSRNVALVIVDPFDPTDNVARGISEPVWALIHKEIRDARNVLLRTASFRAICKQYGEKSGQFTSVFGDAGAEAIPEQAAAGTLTGEKEELLDLEDVEARLEHDTRNPPLAESERKTKRKRDRKKAGKRTAESVEHSEQKKWMPASATPAEAKKPSPAPSAHPAQLSQPNLGPASAGRVETRVASASTVRPASASREGVPPQSESFSRTAPAVVKKQGQKGSFASFKQRMQAQMAQEAASASSQLQTSAHADGQPAPPFSRRKAFQVDATSRSEHAEASSQAAVADSSPQR
jgi:DNA polymerase sigma